MLEAGPSFFGQEAKGSPSVGQGSRRACEAEVLSLTFSCQLLTLYICLQLHVNRRSFASRCIMLEAGPSFPSEDVPPSPMSFLRTRSTLGLVQIFCAKLVRRSFAIPSVYKGQALHKRATLLILQSYALHILCFFLQSTCLSSYLQRLSEGVQGGFASEGRIGGAEGYSIPMQSTLGLLRTSFAGRGNKIADSRREKEVSEQSFYIFFVQSLSEGIPRCFATGRTKSRRVLGFACKALQSDLPCLSKEVTSTCACKGTCEAGIPQGVLSSQWGTQKVRR